MPQNQHLIDLKKKLDVLRKRGGRKVSWDAIAKSLGVTEQHLHRSVLKKNDMWISQVPGLALALDMPAHVLAKLLFSTADDQEIVAAADQDLQYGTPATDGMKDEKIQSLESLVRLQREEIEVLQRLLKYNKIERGEEKKGEK